MNGLEQAAPDRPTPDRPGLVTENIEGASFPWAVKALATAPVAALAGLAWRLSDQISLAGLDQGKGTLLLAAAIVIAAGYWGIMIGRTGIADGVIRQRWLWVKEVRVEDITQIKLIHAPRLSWIVVPRLVVRSRGVGLSTFQTGDPRVLAMFRHLVSGSQ